MAEPIALGPWPPGLDNVHPPRHAVFQLPGKDGPRPRLAVATDVELDDEGWPRTRPLVASTAVLDGEGIVSVAGRLFYQAEGSLYEHGNATALVTGLSSKARLAEFGGRIFGSDGTTHFEIDGATVRTWGLPVPTVALASTAPTAAALRTNDRGSVPRAGLRRYTMGQPLPVAAAASSRSGLSAVGMPTASSIGVSSPPLE